jgi:hypothetical protein
MFMGRIICRLSYDRLLLISQFVQNIKIRDKDFYCALVLQIIALLRSEQVVKDLVMGFAIKNI